MNKIKFLVLKEFEKEECYTPMKSLSAYDLSAEFEKLEYSRIYFTKILKEFESNGLLKRGLDDRRAHTFYLTDEGKEFIGELKEEYLNEK